jgi:hypothetical protein
MVKVLTQLQDGVGRLVQTRKGTRYQKSKPTHEQLVYTGIQHCIKLNLACPYSVIFQETAGTWSDAELKHWLTLNVLQAIEWLEKRD